MKRVVIVGGGISGLSVAYALRGKAQVTLLEANALGGVIQTDRTGLYVVEGGPDSFVTARPAALDLCREIGLEGDLIPMALRKLYVRSGGVFHEMPPGFFLTVPTKIGSVLKSGLFSWKGKLRMGMEYFLPRGGDEEESIGSFVRRRFGQEMVDKVADPLMGGIYSGPADEISLRATFPQFQKMEREHRSLIRAMRKTKMSEGSPLMSLRGGMATLVDRLLEKLDVEIIQSRVLRIEADRRVVHEKGSLEADEVVVATPAPRAAEILQNWPDLTEALGQIPFASSVTVSLAYDRKAIPHALDATGFILPRSEGRRIHACSWSSSKFENRAPKEGALIRCFLRGEPTDPESIAREELRDLLGVEAEPQFVRTWRWPKANPVYEVSHQKRVVRIESSTPEGIHITGAGYRGSGIPHCIQDGKAMAADVLER